MAAVANNPGEFTIGSLNDSTGWFKYDASTQDICFSITGTWSGTIAFQTSNQDDYTKSRTSTVTSYTANQSPLALPKRIGRYFRFTFTSYSSGTAYIGLTKGTQPDGETFNISPQGNDGAPTGSFA